MQLYRWLPLLNNCRLSDFVDRIYLIEFEIKDTADTYISASYLDLLLKIHSEWCLRTELYDKKDNYNLPIVNFPFIRSSIRAPPVYGVYISQLIRYSRACGSYKDFLDRRLLLTAKLLNQGFLLIELISSLRKFDGRHHGLVNRYRIAVSQMTTDILCVSNTLSVLSSFMTYYRVCIYHYDTSGTSGAGNDYPSGAHTVFCGVHVFPSLVWCAMLLWIVVCTFYFFWSPLWWLFFDLRILITPFVSSSSSSMISIDISG